MAPPGGPIAASSYPFARLRNHHVAAVFIHGDHDEHSNPRWSRLLAGTARKDGVDASLPIASKGHDANAWTAVIPRTFDFVSHHVNQRH
jgi:hypothetical protein